MTRTRQSRAELTESWDAMEDSQEVDSLLYDEEEERDEMGDDYKPRMSGRPTASGRDNPRRRNLRSSVEPELVMPSSPDAVQSRSAKQRAQTPHFRMNQRSLTSDAGEIRRQTRSSTPRMRMANRSATSDAGHFTSKMRDHVDAEYDSDEEDGGNRLGMIVLRILHPLLAYTVDVVGLLLGNLKPLIAYVLLIYLVIAAFIFASGFISNSINNALSPVCRLPFSSTLPFCPSTKLPELKGNAEFDKLVQAQDAFQDVLASSSTGVNLPLDMKRSEAGIRDLKHVVQYSTLPSRGELVFEFTGFIETARQASQDLSRFNSRIGRAVDQILSTNRWTLSVIDGVTAEKASRGAISGWISDNLNIFAPFQPISFSRDVLLDQYLRHTGAVEEQILALIDQALALRDILDNLDGRLDLIAGIVTRDGIKVDSSKDELFATLWTKLGGNRATVAKLNQQLQLLNDVNGYRRMAWGHVSNTLLKLQEIQASLEDLRERVTLPETVGTDKVPLEVHIEAINLGIERLENQRDVNREVEAQRYARIVGKAEDHDRREIEGGRKEL